MKCQSLGVGGSTMKESSFTFKREVIRDDLKDDRVFARKMMCNLGSGTEEVKFGGL